jgi:hypothetical protein
MADVKSLAETAEEKDTVPATEQEKQDPNK